MGGIVVVGGGQAGASLVAKLRSSGYEGALTLICEEPVPPYQRPPLSKKYLLGEMERDEVESILEQMPPQEAADTRRLIDHAPDSAGGIMITEYLAYPDQARIGEILDDLEANRQTFADYSVQYIYVTGAHGELVGVPISAGVVQGTVKVLHRADEKKLLPGEILVTRATDPGWTPLFIHAGGIILEIGGALQHGAVVVVILFLVTIAMFSTTLGGLFLFVCPNLTVTGCTTIVFLEVFGGCASTMDARK